MDKTPRYIEMSEKATKIQALWEPQDGDWFAVKRDLIAAGSLHYALKDEVYQVTRVAEGRIHFAKNIVEGNLEIVTYHLQYLHKPAYFKLTWLPTQSQLQNLLIERIERDRKYNRVYIGEHSKGFIMRCALTDFFHWLEKERIDYSFTSMEQLLFAFCMHEIYKENWDNKKRKWGYLTKRERIGYYPLTV